MTPPLPPPDDRHPPSTSDAYFASMYDGSPDPWGFDTSEYERRKYAVTLASLTRTRYHSAFEPGCANGAFTAMLADRCDRLTACDIMPSVVDRARARVADLALDHVTVAPGRMPDFWPTGELDLIVWSEVAYYLGKGVLDRAVAQLDRHLAPGGELVVVSYTGDTDYPQTADSVFAAVDSGDSLERVVTHRDELFRLDIWRRAES